MCYVVFIGTTEKQQLEEFVPRIIDLYFKPLTIEQENEIRPKFNNPYLYEVGSNSGCSCGFQFHSSQFNNPEKRYEKKSAAKLLEFIQERTAKEDLEFYCCWYDDWDDPIKYKIELDIRTISLAKNYFGLTEGLFITFKRKV